MPRRLTLRRVRPSERRVLQAKLRTTTLPVRLHQRYRIVAEAARGHPGPVIADRVGCDVDTVYVWVHRVTTSGFDTFERPTNPKGREPILTSAQVRALVTVTLSRPADLHAASETVPDEVHTLHAIGDGRLQDGVSAVRPDIVGPFPQGEVARGFEVVPRGSGVFGQHRRPVHAGRDGRRRRLLCQGMRNRVSAQRAIEPRHEPVIVDRGPVGC